MILTHNWNADLLPHEYDFYDTFESNGFVEYIEWYKTKSGKISINPRHVCIGHFTVLRNCNKCGKLGTFKKVKYWNLFCVRVSKRELRNGEDYSLCGWVCWSCRNKIYPISKKFEEAYQLKKQIAKSVKAMRGICEYPEKEIIAVFDK